MNKKHGLLFGFAVIAIAAMFTLAGCPTEDDGSGGGGGGGTNTDSGTDSVSYTFEFRVDNSSGKTIKKVEFFSDYISNRVSVFTDSLINLSSGNRSRIYEVSGFTEGIGSEHAFTVQVTFSDDTTVINYDNAKNGSKIRVSVDRNVIRLYDGNW
jgi:hypothetical protein